MSKKVRKGKKSERAFILVQDIVFIAVGIVIATALAKSGVLSAILNSFHGYYFIAAFISGILFTSVFTLAPSSIALVHIAENAPIHGVALFGALGAMCGDLLLLYFIRDRFTDDLLSVLKPQTVRKFMRLFHFGFMKWLSPIIGAAIIASPLPDEFGITLLGVSKVKLSLFIPLAFIMNAFGIYLLIGFAGFF